MYKILKNIKYKNGDYNLAPFRSQDIYKIKDWRNNQINVLRQKIELTDEDQKHYYHNVIKQTFNNPIPQQMLFSFLLRSKCIGYGGLTNIDWESRRAELTFLLDDKRATNNSIYRQDFSIFISFIKQLVFDDLKFNRIFTETFDIRPLHISILELNGFVLEGRMRQHIVINGEFFDSLLHGFIKEQYVTKE
jgi:RimJ/RimL family protein N-acetyltransferase